MLRIVDSGLRDARFNLSLTEALSRGRAAGTTPDTLRFQHFPPSAIIGRHQLLHREVDLDWTAAHRVQTARRMTGGGDKTGGQWGDLRTRVVSGVILAALGVGGKIDEEDLVEATLTQELWWECIDVVGCRDDEDGRGFVLHPTEE